MPLIASRAGGSASGFGGLRTFGAALAPDAGAMLPIGSVVVGSSGSATISFSSIPSTYKHLQVRCTVRSTNSNSNDLGGLQVRFNGDTTGTNYGYHFVYSNGSTFVASGAQDSHVIGFINSSNYGSTVYSANIIDIYDYASSSKYKTTKSFSGFDGNSAGYVILSSGHWRNNNAISSITFTPWNGNFSQHSRIDLYGIKGA